MDIARLGLAVDSSQVEKGTVSLHQLTGAAGQAAAAAQRLGTASGVEAAGVKAATAATVAHTAALNVQNNVMRSTAQQRTMMVYQLNDVAVSLASGMNPAMVAMQQGSQILQGGLMPAIRTLADLAKGLVVAFWPVAAVVGAVSLAVAGLTHEINQTAAVQVSFFDVALAGWQLFAESVASLVAPVFGQLGTWLQQGWDLAVPILKGIGNTIIGAFSFAIQAVGSLWNGLPAAVGEAIIKTANIVISGLEWTINRASEYINGFIGKYNEGLSAMGQATLPTFGGVEIPRAANPFEGAGASLGNDLGSNASSAFGKDYMGGAFDAISDRAQQIASARKETEELGGAADEANKKMTSLASDGFGQVKTWAEEFGAAAKSAFSGLGTGIIDAFQKGGDVASNVLNMLMDKVGKLGESLLNNGLDGLMDMGINALMGAIGGGFGGSKVGMDWASLVSSFDGGGFTGSGSRSGGMDGKGGFPAILHPNETVLDHTKGAANQNQANDNGGSRGPVQLIVQVSGARGNAEVMEMARAGAQEALDAYDRFTLPGRVNDLKGDTMVVKG